MLKLQNVFKTYQMGEVAVPALKDITLEVRAGEILCIMGKSGSGKSSLLRITGLIDKPSFGNVELDGVSLGDLREGQRAELRLRNFGFVFQEYALLPELTAFENVGLPARMLGVKSKEYCARTSELLASVDLLSLKDHRPKQLSGGEQQRVAIARALVNRPEIIFADEPTANLDSASSLKVMQVLGSLNERHKTTVIFVTHDPDEIDYANRVVRLYDGQIMRDWTKDA